MDWGSIKGVFSRGLVERLFDGESKKHVQKVGWDGNRD